jgi:hypothetical protein
MIVDREHHVTFTEFSRTGTIFFDRTHNHAGVVVGETKCVAFSSVQQLKIADRQIDIPVVATGGDILKKTLDHRRRNHVAGVLRDIAGIPLEGNADHFSVLQYRAAGISRIDCSVDLNC